MNSSPSPQSFDVEAKSPSGSAFVRLLVILALLFVLLLLFGGWFVLETLGLLGFGWISFLSRVIPKISWNWDLIGMAVLCLAGLLGIVHAFIKWLTAQIANARGAPWTWTWRWTWCSAAAIGLLFLVGMAVGGIFHQAAWIAASPEPLYENRSGYSVIGELKRFQLALRRALVDSKEDWQLARRELKNLENQYLPARPGQMSPTERICCLLIVDSQDRCVGGILFPRAKLPLSSPNELLYWHQDEDSWLPRSKLEFLLRSHQGQLIAL